MPDPVHVGVEMGVPMRAAVMPGSLPAADPHGYMRPRDAAFHGALAHIFHTGDPDGIQFRQKGAGIGKQLQQRRRQHIARRAHAAVQVKNSHHCLLRK